MGLIDQFNSLYRRFFAAQTKTTGDETEQQIQPRRRGLVQTMSEIRLQRDRRSVVEDCRAMYGGDTRPEAMIRTLAADATKNGFVLTIEDDAMAETARQVAEELGKRLNLMTRIDDWIRLTLRDGDTFNELSVDRSGDIVEITRKPTLEMYRNSDRYDRFPDPTRAFYYSEENFNLGRIPDDAIFFAQWQIVHGRWNHDEGSRYGRPMFASGRKSFKRIEEGESNIAIRRKVRAGRRYQHRIEGSAAAVEEYMRTNQDALDNPFAAVQDFFGNADIRVIEGDDTVGDIADILHHIDTFAFGSPVPLTLIGYGKELNRDILEQKLQQYKDAQKAVAKWAVAQLYEPLLKVQWLLKGVYYPNLVYTLEPASKETVDAQTLLTVAQAGAALKALGWPDDIIIDTIAPMIPGLDVEGLKKAIEAAAANQPDEIDRIAAAAANAAVQANNRQQQEPEEEPDEEEKEDD